MHRLAPSFLLILGSAAPARAQQEPPVEFQTSRTETITVPEGAEIDPMARSVVRPLRDRGTGFRGDVLVRDRSVPRPFAATVAPGHGGDQLLREATGDPFFLGFAAGPYHPPAGERVDPQLLADLSSTPRDGRGTDELYGFVMLGERISEELVDQLRDLGMRPLGFHPHHALSAAIRLDSVSALSAHPAVHWVGAARRWQKIDPRLQERLVAAQTGDVLDVWVNVFESDLCSASTARAIGVMTVGDPGVPPRIVYDEALMAKTWMSHGWQQRALEGLGLGITEYVDGIRAFRASGTAEAIARALERDFVYFVEPIAELALHHDESTPLVNSDAARALYDGRHGALAGLLDSGFNATHDALDHVAWVGWDYRNTATPGALTTDDICGHGSHVAGTILGLPENTTHDEHRGNAPGLGYSASGRFRIVRAFGAGSCPSPSNCCWLSLATTAAMYSNFATPYSSGGFTTPKAHAVNNSWGAAPCTSTCACTPWIGTDAESRTADTTVDNDDIFYVFSAGNNGSCGSGSVGLPGVAKNVFTVGSVNDHYVSATVTPGTISSFSSRGPTADGRWKPNAVAPGEDILSVQAGASGSYVEYDGTSMAAPHVTGIAAQLCDAHPFLRNAPARVAALLMGTALSKGDLVLTSPSVEATHMSSYGAGRVDALLAQVELPWYTSENWGFTMDTPAAFQYGEFTVPATNVKRLVVCMTYHEAAAAPGASSALINNLDLWLDRAPIDPAGNTGEYFSQQSTVDNTEIRYVESPAAGAWRWKVFPTSLSSRVKVSVQVVLVDAQTSPPLQVALTGQPWAKTGTFEIGVDVEPDTGIASGTHITHTATRMLPTPASISHIGAYSILKDGVSANHMDNASGGQRLSLGNALESDPRSARWVFSEPLENEFQIAVSADADNTPSRTAQFTVRTDGTRPTAASNLASSTHAANTWSMNPNVAFAWTAGTDARSGVDGYSVLLSTSAAATIDETVELGAVTSTTVPCPSSTAGLYFYVRTVDRAGWGASTSARTGPYLIDTEPPTLPSVFSTSHPVNIWMPNRGIAFQITPATDAHSGLAGYSVVFDTAPGVVPPASVNLVGTATTTFYSVTDSVLPYYLKIRSRDNAGNWSANLLELGPYRIDAGVPGLPTNLRSTSHTLNSWSNDPTVDLAWTAATDAHSGVLGYGDLIANTSGAPVSTSRTLGAVTSQVVTLSSTSLPWYYSLRTVDNAGNWSSTSAEIGPFRIDTGLPTAPSSVVSSTHAPSTWTSNDRVAVSFAPGSDALSGLAGYVAVWNQSPSTSLVQGNANVAANASSIVSSALGSSTIAYWLHLAALDQAGNFSTTVHAGPYLIDTSAPSLPVGFASTTHATSGWNNASAIGFAWSPGTDVPSGVAETALLLDLAGSSAAQAGGALLGLATAQSRAVLEGPAVFAHLAFRDRAGNWGATAHAGPYSIDVTPPSGVSITLENGAAQTTSLGVNLSMTASDALSGVADLRLRNDGGSWSSWSPFVTSLAWNLSNDGGSAQTGTRTVQIELRDVAGNVAAASDTIRYVILPQVFGSACAGAAGTPDISVSGVPTLGSSMTIASTPSSAATSSLFLGFSDQSWLGIPLPLDLGLVGVAGCSIHVSLDIALYSGPNAPVPLPIAADPLFGGAQIYFQWIHLADPSGQLVVTSPGMRVTLNHP